MFKEIIEKLLTLKANLNAEEEQKILEAVQSIEQEFADKKVKIDNALNIFGYKEPANEEVCTDETLNNDILNVNYNETI